MDSTELERYTAARKASKGRTPNEIAKDEELEKLREFYNAVARLTIDHYHLECEHYHHAVVFPRDLGEALAKVDPEWWKLDKEAWEKHWLLHLKW